MRPPQKIALPSNTSPTTSNPGQGKDRTNSHHCKSCPHKGLRGI
jgi:hypothetical protein